MKKLIIILSLGVIASVIFLAMKDNRNGFEKGTPKIGSMSALEFSPEGTLFIGDSRKAQIIALDLPSDPITKMDEPFYVQDLEGKLAARLGASADAVLIHDMAVHPQSKEVYLTASLGRGKWLNKWDLPNDLADANLLIKVDASGNISEVSLSDIYFSAAEIPNPIAADAKHRWKKSSPRVDVISDLAYADGQLYVAGLSNEEFASTFRILPFPFKGKMASSTLEIYHGAHQQYETQSPIRTCMPYTLNGKAYLLAAYLCTPFVVFPLEDLRDGAHVKGKTVAELGSGNYPLDMLSYNKGGEEYILLTNSDRGLMRIDPDDIVRLQEGLSPENEDTRGIPFHQLSGTGILRVDKLNDEYVLVLRRMNSGSLDLMAMHTQRM